jgi:hypothetical protein
VISIWTTLFSVGLNNTVFDFPRFFPKWLMWYPTFNMTRIIYTITYKCGFKECISSYTDISDEMFTCLIFLYLTPFVFMILGIYLYEIIPQKYGIKRHPLFCFSKFCRMSRWKRVINDFGLSDSSFNDSGVLGEAKLIENIEDRSKFPLVVEGLIKVYQLLI